MWPFKSKIPVVENIIFENEGQTVTIFHDKGVHKFNKDEVLDSYLSTDEFSKYKLNWFPADTVNFHAFYALILFGGWLNTMMAIFPDRAAMYDDVVSTHDIFNTSQTLLFWTPPFFAVIFTLLTLYITALLFRYIRARYDDDYKNATENHDILVFCLNNQTIKLRIGGYHTIAHMKYDDNWCAQLINLNYLKNRTIYSRNSDGFINSLINNPLNGSLVIFCYIPIILLLIFFNWDKPFIIWQWIESMFNSNLSFKAFLAEHKETFEYWKYYAEIDTITKNEIGETIATIKYNTNPIIAFFDGVLGGALLIGVVFTGLTFVMLGMFLGLLIASVFLNVFLFFIPLISVIKFKFNTQFYKYYWIFLGSKFLLILMQIILITNLRQVATFIGFSHFQTLIVLYLIIGLSLNVFHAYIFIRKKGFSKWSRKYFWVYNLDFEDYEWFNKTNNLDRTINTISSKLSLFEHLSDELKNDEQFIWQLFYKSEGRIFPFLLEKFKNDREFVLEAVKQKGELLKYVSEEFKNDREVVMEAVKQDGGSLKYASEEFKNDREVVMEAVKQKSWSFYDASNSLKKNRDFVIEIVKIQGHALKYASHEFKNDREVVMEAVKNHDGSFEHASNSLKKNRDFVIEVVKTKGYALKYASEELKNDRDVVIEAVGKYSVFSLSYVSFEYASNELKDNKDFVIEVVKANGYALKYASDKLKNDRDVVIEAVKRNGRSLKYASDELRNDRDVVIEALKESWPFEYASDSLKKNRDFILKIIELFFDIYINSYEKLSDFEKNDTNILVKGFKDIHILLFKELPLELKEDKEILLAISNGSILLFQIFNDEIKNDFYFALTTLQFNYNIFPYLTAELKDNRNFILEALTNNGNVLKYLSEELKNDREVVERAIYENKNSIIHASEELKSSIDVNMETVVSIHPKSDEKQLINFELGREIDKIN
jgi:hypothetical protein